MSEVSMTDNNTVDERPVVLKVDHVAKSFRLPTEQATGLKMAFLNWTKGIKGYTEQHVLRDINFEVHQGDFFGIVGRNGSGKSTLLKIISQIYVPEQGSVMVKGKLVPFIELGVGFNPELTGRENVYLNGALLGFTHEEIDAMYDDIVEFAKLEDFMDQKLKNYSSGMQVRLAFSVAIKAQGDILVLDEVLAVGDEAFQRKCDNFFAEIKKDPTKTVILVTHSMDAVKKYCNKAILIKDGEIIASGDKNNVADRYTLENLKTNESNKHDSSNEEICEEMPILRVYPNELPVCESGTNFKFTVEYNNVAADKKIYLNIVLLDISRGGIALAQRFMTVPGHHRVNMIAPTADFNDGEYRIILSAHIEVDPKDSSVDRMITTTNEKESCTFVVQGTYGSDKFALMNYRRIQYQCEDTKVLQAKDSF